MNDLPEDIQNTEFEIIVNNGIPVIEVTYYYHEWPYGLQTTTRQYTLTEISEK